MQMQQGMPMPPPQGMPQQGGGQISALLEALLGSGQPLPPELMAMLGMDPMAMMGGQGMPMQGDNPLEEEFERMMQRRGMQQGGMPQQAMPMQGGM